MDIGQAVGWERENIWGGVGGRCCILVVYDTAFYGGNISYERDLHWRGVKRFFFQSILNFSSSLFRYKTIFNYQLIINICGVEQSSCISPKAPHPFLSLSLKSLTKYTFMTRYCFREKSRN